MKFPFETTTKDGLKVTVLGKMPDGRLAGFVKFAHAFAAWDWNADGSDAGHDMSITLPLQIKPLTTYRMREGGIALTTKLADLGSIFGVTDAGKAIWWSLENGRVDPPRDGPFDLIEELPPGTTD